LRGIGLFYLLKFVAGGDGSFLKSPLLRLEIPMIAELNSCLKFI